jgi:chromate transport protein ChrA
MHSITISTENDMAGLIVVFWLEGIVRPMVAGFVCIIFLTIARYIIKKSTKTMLLGHKPIILILISTLVINLIITAVQLNYGLYGVY